MFNVVGQAGAKAQQDCKCSLLQLQAPLAQNPMLVAGFLAGNQNYKL